MGIFMREQTNTVKILKVNLLYKLDFKGDLLFSFPTYFNSSQQFCTVNFKFYLYSTLMQALRFRLSL